MPTLMTSQTIVEKIYATLKAEVAELVEQGKVPSLAVVLVGEDEASEIYVGIKSKRAQELGINVTVHRFAPSVTERTVVDLVKNLNEEPTVSGIIVQLPLPRELDTQTIIDSISKEKDVDGLRTDSLFMPPTVNAILELLEAYDIELVGKKIIIVGKGRLVGSPLHEELKGLNLDVTTCDESIDDLSSCTLEADILISATGEPNLIRPEMVKEGAVVIDVDTDVIFDEVAAKASYITPQKGGVGPLTVAHLLSNVTEVAAKQHER